ncbi:checkpoint clamp complex protein Rad1 [Lecanora helva]
MGSIIGSNKPLMTAVSGSARQLFQLLRCLNFAAKSQVQITKDGLRFTVGESQVMQEKSLFAAYTYSPPPQADNDPEDFEAAPFEVSLSSLLETLQIFGINDTKDRWSNRDSNQSNPNSFTSRGASSALDSRVLGMNGLCRLSYYSPGEPFCIILEEKGITTSCELVTYEPGFQEEIPLQKDAIVQKIIMRASWLHDAIDELSSTSPTRLTIVSSPKAPYFTLSSTGPLGSATVEFSKDPQLLETFQVPSRTVNTYKYSLIKGAGRAMAIASKVSIRSDEQGVMSLQFMIEVESGGFSFVDFRFVPFIPEAGEGEESEVDEAEPSE